MSKYDSNIITSRHTSGDNISIKKYFLGFILSLTLTLTAFFLVYKTISTDHPPLALGVLIGAIFLLAIAQLIVQLQFFIHLGHDEKPGWNRLAFLFMILVIVIVAGGSIWIMDNLHYNMMTPVQTDEYMIESERVM